MSLPNPMTLDFAFLGEGYLAGDVGVADDETCGVETGGGTVVCKFGIGEVS